MHDHSGHVSPELAMRRLLDSLATAAPEGEADADGTRILFRLDVDGFEYALTQLRRSQPARLSPREMEIIRLVATGMPNKCIGAALDISAWTVATYLRRIFAKLGVTSRAAMVAHAGARPALPARRAGAKAGSPA